MIYKGIPFEMQIIFSNSFSQWQKKVEIFLDIYISVEIHALSIYDVFRTFWALLPWLIQWFLILRFFFLGFEIWGSPPGDMLWPKDRIIKSESASQSPEKPENPVAHRNRPCVTQTYSTKLKIGEHPLMDHLSRFFEKFLVTDPPVTSLPSILLKF